MRHPDARHGIDPWDLSEDTEHPARVRSRRSADDDLFALDPQVIEVWHQRRSRRLAVRAGAWLALAGITACALSFGRLPRARDAMLSWATLGRAAAFASPPPSQGRD